MGAEFIAGNHKIRGVLAADPEFLSLTVECEFRAFLVFTLGPVAQVQKTGSGFFDLQPAEQRGIYGDPFDLRRPESVFLYHLSIQAREQKKGHCEPI